MSLDAFAINEIIITFQLSKAIAETFTIYESKEEYSKKKYDPLLLWPYYFYKNL